MVAASLRAFAGLAVTRNSWKTQKGCWRVLAVEVQR